MLLTGVVANMTIEEFNNAKREDDLWVILVLDHKTSNTHGVARVLVANDIYDMMTSYLLDVGYKITTKEESSHQLLLTLGGKELINLSEKMCKVDNSYQHTSFSE